MPVSVVKERAPTAFVGVSSLTPSKVQVSKNSVQRPRRWMLSTHLRMLTTERLPLAPRYPSGNKKPGAKRRAVRRYATGHSAELGA